MLAIKSFWKFYSHTSRGEKWEREEP